MDRTTLVQEVADLASAYLGRGARIPNVKSDAPTDRIDDIEELLVRYFIVTGVDRMDEPVAPAREASEPEVIPFVRKLPGRIKRLQTTTEPEQELTRGHIKRRVDWAETAKTRSQRGTTDSSLFVCQQPSRQIATPANRVLATLLDRIERIVRDQLRIERTNPESYEWLAPWTEDSPLYDTVTRLKFENPYLSEIPVENQPLDETIIESVKSARTPLYREAAKLLAQYQRYERGEYTKSELQELFNTLFVGPAGMPELFELYWAYRLLDTYETPSLKAITGRSNEVARWAEDGAEYRLLYRTASSEPPAFYVSLQDAAFELETLDEVAPDGATFTQRFADATETAATLKEELLGKSGVQRSLWSGEPDLTLTKRDPKTGALLGVFIGEVKYTESADPRYIRDRASDGLDDLAEYLALIRGDVGEYLATDDAVPVRGGVFTPQFTPQQRSHGDVMLIPYRSTLSRPV